MEMQTTFLGETIEFWTELRHRVDQLGVAYLIADLAKANAKVRYYETMINRMNDYRKVVDA